MGAGGIYFFHLRSFSFLCFSFSFIFHCLCVCVCVCDRQMSMEWGEYGIRVNAIAPGFIDAGMQAPFFENRAVRELRANAVPLKRLGSADDVAHCALFLASEQAAYISGENIAVDGGVINSVLMQLPRS